jgi:Zn-finger nucleic acid-binding protein
LIIIERNQIELDHCLSCHGLWFDAEELELLFSSLAEEQMARSLEQFMALPRRDIHEKPLKCPRCRHKMDKVVVESDEDILLDRCRRGDGLWFDGGELHQMVTHLENVTEGGPGRALRFVEEVFPAEPARAGDPEPEDETPTGEEA